LTSVLEQYNYQPVR